MKRIISKMIVIAGRALVMMLLCVGIVHTSSAQINYIAHGTTTPAGVSLGTAVFNMTPTTATFQGGTLWCNTGVDFSRTFLIDFDARMDSTRGQGADGFTVLFGRNIVPATTVTAFGGGDLCYLSSAGDHDYDNSFAVEFDTYYNGPTTYCDITADHVSIDVNRNACSAMPSLLGALPVAIDPAHANVKDNVYRHYRIVWDPRTKVLMVYCGCILRIISNYDYTIPFGAGAVTAIPWGFTGATGADCSNHNITNIELTYPVIDTLVLGRCSSHCDTTLTVPVLTPTTVATSGYWTSSVGAPVMANTLTTTCTDLSTYNAISYNNGTVCDLRFTTFVLHVLPPPAAIAGPTEVCVGSDITLTNTTAGGTWTSSGPGIGSIDATTGILTGISSGTVTVSYTTGVACTETYTVTVTPVPTAISGSLAICTGTPSTLSSSPPGGTWSSGDPGVADVDASGEVTGGMTGTATITYAMSSACYTTVEVTVNPSPTLLGRIRALCEGETITIGVDPLGGTWACSPATVATITPTGDLTGIDDGTAMVTYTVGACSIIKVITVNPLPGPISGGPILCTGTPITFTDPLPGGDWSSSGTVDVDPATGDVLSASVGTAEITYSVNGCEVTLEVTVDRSPRGISGRPLLCEGATVTFGGSPSGGIWDCTPATVATITPTGDLTGIDDGTVTVSYTIGACSTTIEVTVNPIPGPISGGPIICTGATAVTFTDPYPGGDWSSSGTVDVDPFTGDVISASVGTAEITYSLNRCQATLEVTVNETPDPIGGPTSVCEGATITLIDLTPGGVWTCAPAGTATVSATGDVTGILAGTATVTYTIAGCSVTYIVTVTPAPGPISGGPAVCYGLNVALSDPVGGGVWSSTGTVSVSPTGVATGVSLGTGTVTYAIGSCEVTKVLTVTPSPSVISGPGSVCKGATITLTNTEPGGTWSCTPVSVATITPTGGVLTGRAAGTATVTYAIGSCIATKVITVNPAPNAITNLGPNSLCVGESKPLANTVTGGTWSWSSVGTGSVTMTALGPLCNITGAAAGTVTITYAIGSCYVTKVFTVNPVPVITGPPYVCSGGTVVTLNATVAGGTWSILTGPGSIGPSSGIFTSAGAGTTNIVYNAAGCPALFTIRTVKAPAISAPKSKCQYMDFTATTTTPGGTWSSSDPLVGSIDATTGAVTTYGAGTLNITYTLPGGCFTTWPVVIDAKPVITEPIVVCVGASLTLTVTPTSGGGMWATLPTYISTVTPTTGILTGVGAGDGYVGYQSQAGCRDTARVHVDSLPYVHTNNEGGFTTLNTCTAMQPLGLHGEPAGGVWTSSDPAIGSIDPSGTAVVPISAGTVVLTYTYTAPGGCSGIATNTLNVMLSPTVSPTYTTLCMGSTFTPTFGPAGGTWRDIIYANANIDATTGTVTPFYPGTFYAEYQYGGCVARDTVEIIGVPAGRPCVEFYVPNGAFQIPAPAGSLITYKYGSSLIPTPITTVVVGVGVLPGSCFQVPHFAGCCGTTSWVQVLSIDAPPCYFTPTCPPHYGLSGYRGVAPGGTNTGEEMHDIVLTPNPNNGQFTVSGIVADGDKELQLEVVNAIGQVVYKAVSQIEDNTINEQVRLDDKIANGIYILRLRNNEVTKTIRFSLDR